MIASLRWWLRRYAGMVEGKMDLTPRRGRYCVIYDVERLDRRQFDCHPRHWPYVAPARDEATARDESSSSSSSSASERRVAAL